MTQPRLLGGRYELDGIVGRGGMAEVFRARDIRLDRIVAVKTLRDDLARDQTFQARFRREAQSAASLNHPSIVAVYDTGEDMVGPTLVPYIVMEYVDGRTLRDLLREDRRLLPERAMEISDGVLRALDYSHRNGIVHRDIKPGNVMLTRAGDVKVMDFGIARAVSDSQATMTQTAQVIGTAQYLSPEQARGERVDARSDLYSAGCLLYELLTGRPPFTGDSPVAIAYQHVRENPIPPSRVDPEIPGWADAIVLKAMAKDPADRYQSAGDMRNDIQRALSGMPVAAPTRTDLYQGTRRMGQGTMAAGPTSAIPAYRYGPEDQPPPGKRRRLWLWVAISLVALLILGGIGYAVHYAAAGGGKISVPAVAGHTRKQAQKEIAKANLVSAVVLQASSTTPRGIVIRTSPTFGTLVAANSTVTLYVSTGPAKKPVPDVIGKKELDAESELTNAGFKVGKPRTDPSSSQPQGTVIDQSPAGNTLAKPGITVTITVSGGGISVPNVIGQSLQTAEGTLRADNLSYRVNFVPAQPGTTPGTVVGQSPAPPKTVPPGTQITLTVAQEQTPTPTATPTPTDTSPSPTPTDSKGH
jgi:beta-lactam-binding protein with PASTA domain/tRNA A-37 threonylcarbamoyl transferase component Bud32